MRPSLLTVGTMLVLGLETSCDETGVALYDTERGLLADALFSQVDIHVEYGGVVPELASRDHIRKTLPLVEQVLADAGCSAGDIDGVAYTAGPGLVGALLFMGRAAEPEALRRAAYERRCAWRSRAWRRRAPILARGAPWFRVTRRIRSPRQVWSDD